MGCIRSIQKDSDLGTVGDQPAPISPTNAAVPHTLISAAVRACGPAMTVDTPVESSTARVLKQCFGIRADKAASEALASSCRLPAIAGTSGYAF
jgi:hypothetical protein